MERQTPPAVAPAPKMFARCSCGETLAPGQTDCSTCIRRKQYFGTDDKMGGADAGNVGPNPKY